MEPRPHERGKVINQTGKGKQSECFNGATSSRTWKVGGRVQVGQRLRLQWSHVLTNVESEWNPVSQKLIGTASMEPRPHERGKT